jgi:pterin-4a-carbinolamine dehydratase
MFYVRRLTPVFELTASDAGDVTEKDIALAKNMDKLYSRLSS